MSGAIMTHAQATWARELLALGKTNARIHQLTGVSAKTIKEMRKAMQEGTTCFKACAPYRCPMCRGQCHVTPCVACHNKPTTRHRHNSRHRSFTSVP